MRKDLYGTPEMVKNFRKGRTKNDGEMPDFLETLHMMEQEGALSEDPLPVPVLNGSQSISAFAEAYDRIPFNASQIFQNEKIRKQDSHDNAVFPPGRDAVTVQHIHDYGYRDQPHGNFIAVTYLYRGNCHFLFEEEPVLLEEGDLCIVMPHFPHRIHTDPDTFALEALIREESFPVVFHDFLAVSTRLSDFFTSSLSSGQHNYCILHTDPEDKDLRFYLQSFVQENAMNDVYCNSNAISLLKLFFGLTFRRYGDSISFFDSGFHRRRMDAASILQYIQKNYMDITLDQTAEHFHYNKTYLSRYIKEHFGKTFIALVTDLKIEQARNYLRDTNRHISDIALLVGYDTPDHFSRTFRKQCGMSPAEFRRRNT